MKKNHFSKIMEQKTNEELNDIISKNSKYTNDAMQAALWEIERKHNQLEGSTIDQEVSISIDTQKIIKNREFIQNEESDNFFENEKHILDDPSLPELYTKNFILLISFLLPILFGSIFLMNNLKTLNLKKQGIHVLVFGIFTSILIGLLSYYTNPFVALVVNILSIGILTEYFWNKYIGKEFKYRRRKIIFV